MRSQALSFFTRNLNSLNNLLNASSPLDVVIPQFEKVQKCWEKLESAQERYVDKCDIDIETDKDGLMYLDEPGERHDAVLLKYSM